MSNIHVRAMVAIDNPSTETMQRIRQELRYTNPAYVRQIKFGSVYAQNKPKQFLVGYVEQPDANVVWVPRGWYYNELHSLEGPPTNVETTQIRASFPSPLVSPLQHQLEALDAFINLVDNNDIKGRPTDAYVVFPPGGGKTIFGMLAAYSCKQKTLVIVPTKEIEEAWVKDATLVFGEDAKSLIGHARGKKIDTSKLITIGSVQTLMKLDPKLWASAFGLVIFDELHRIAAEMFSNCAKRCRAHIRLGLTATDFRRDGRFVSAQWHIGNPCYRTEERTNTVPLRYQTVKTNYGMTRDIDAFTFNDLLEDLQNNEARTNAIAWLITYIIQNYPGDILVVSPRTEHITLIADALKTLGVSYCVITGVTKKRKELFQDICAGKYKVTIATTSIMSEGASNPRWHHVVSTMPFSDPKTAIQLSGRAIRKDKNKECGNFWDIVDANPMCRAMYKSRWRALQKVIEVTLVQTLSPLPPHRITHERQ